MTVQVMFVIVAIVAIIEAIAHRTCGDKVGFVPTAVGDNLQFPTGWRLLLTSNGSVATVKKTFQLVGGCC
jgi:hypothetical protein